MSAPARAALLALAVAAAAAGCGGGGDANDAPECMTAPPATDEREAPQWVVICPADGATHTQEIER